MRFGLDDVMDGFEIAYDIKKVLTLAATILLGAASIWLFTFLGQLTGSSAGNIAFLVVGHILNYIICTISLCAVTRMIYKELTLGEKITVKEAFTFSKKNLAPVIFSPALLVLAAGIIVGLEFLVMMLGKIEILSVILSVFTLPAIILTVFAFALALWGSFMAMSVIAVDESSVLGTVTKIYKMLKKSPMQLIAYSTVAMVFGIAVTAVLGILFLASAFTVMGLFGIASGTFSSLAAMDVPSLSLTMNIAVIIEAASLYLLLIFLCSYPAVLAQSFATSIYLKIKELAK